MCRLRCADLGSAGLNLRYGWYGCLLIVSIFYVPLLYAGELVITRNFSEELQAPATFSPAGRNTTEILKEHAPVETELGGAFVTAIAGVPEKVTVTKKGDSHLFNYSWFYYVNGMLAPVGALQYRPAESDHIWWDFHPSDSGMFVTAVIGAWPEPFRSGYGGKAAPTVIWFTERFESEAGELKQILETFGVRGIELNRFNQDSKMDFIDRMPIVVGALPDLILNSAVNLMFQSADRLGLFVKWESNRLVTLGWDGATGSEFSEAGAVVTAKAAFGTEYPVWLVTGTDEPAVQSAVRLVVDRPERIKNRVGVVISGKEVIDVPV